MREKYTSTGKKKSLDSRVSVSKMANQLACRLVWLHSFKVSWDSFANSWQVFYIGPQFGTQVTVKVKASGNGDMLQWN